MICGAKGRPFYFLRLSSIPIYRHQLLAISMESTVAVPSESIQMSIRVIGHESCLVLVLTLQ